ncbi:hypothetical protein KAI87_13480 [Myxococcota bacterium]|nr:hypothetical protein [Myxococcota bacterium]
MPVASENELGSTIQALFEALYGNGLVGLHPDDLLQFFGGNITARSLTIPLDPKSPAQLPAAPLQSFMENLSELEGRPRGLFVNITSGFGNPIQGESLGLHDIDILSVQIQDAYQKQFGEDDFDLVLTANVNEEPGDEIERVVIIGVVEVE